jgi:hypothetical protein
LIYLTHQLTIVKRVLEIYWKKNVPLLHPDSTSIHPRLKIIKHQWFTLVESIDDKDFFTISSKEADLNKKAHWKAKYEVNVLIKQELIIGFKLLSKVVKEDKEELIHLETLATILEQEFSFFIF